MTDENQSDDARYEMFLPCAETEGLIVDALVFMDDVMDVASHYMADEPNDAMAQSGDFSAIDLCQAVKSYAHDLWGDEAVATLHALGIRTSEDVGKIIFALVRAGLVIPSSDESLDDFDGVCRFE